MLSNTRFVCPIESSNCVPTEPFPKRVTSGDSGNIEDNENGSTENGNQNGGNTSGGDDNGGSQTGDDD